MALLTMEQLQCHFTWRPDEGSTKSDLKDVIYKTERKIGREPHMKVAYLTTLAYLYAQKSEVNFVRANDLLSEAEAADQNERLAQLQNDPSCQLITSQFVIRADMLHLRQIQIGRPLTQQEKEPELRALSDLWADAGNRALVFGVKGATFDCFGPMRYQVGAEAFAEASKLQPGNFHWLFGEARLLARLDRQKRQQAASSHQLELWRSAAQVGEASGLTAALFHSYYAEAILHNNELRRECLAQMDKAVSILRKLTQNGKEASQVVYNIGLKVFRHLREDARRRALLDDAMTVSMCSVDPNFYLELAKAVTQAREYKMAIDLLRRGQRFAGNPGHLWVDLELVELQSYRWSKDRTVAEYDSLRHKYSEYNRNSSTVSFRKALYLIKEGHVDEAIDACKIALSIDSEHSQTELSTKKQFFQRLVENREGREETLAWYAENVGCYGPERVDSEALYTAALQRQPGNTFALEHLGRFHLRRGAFDRAAERFQKLPDDHESRRKLLAESLLRNPNSNIQMLQLCLQCGCKDAAPKILDILQDRKTADNAAQRVTTEVLNSPEETHYPLFFDRAVYELCAKIDNILQDADSFFIEQVSDEFEQVVKSRVDSLLELHSLMSREGLQHSAEDSQDRGNLMRTHRLEMTKLHLLGAETNQRELRNMTVSVLKESKEVLDRSPAVLIQGADGREFSYFHAFNQMKNQLGAEIKKNFSTSKSEPEKKKLEMESLVSLLKERPDLASLENVRNHLHEAMKLAKLPNFRQNRGTRDIFSFMAAREHRILSREHCWVIRWIYLVNSEKHGAEILVKELNDQLRSDWSGPGECRTAYDVAHLAAEFAEETWAVFSHDLRETSGDAAATQDVIAGVAELGIEK